jgi:hypothetical protein
MQTLNLDLHYQYKNVFKQELPVTNTSHIFASWTPAVVYLQWIAKSKETLWIYHNSH